MLSAEPVNRLATDYFPTSENISGNSTSTDLEQFRLVVAVTVTILAGLIQLAMGLFHLGCLVVYISSPLLGGFTCASAVHVLFSQLSGLFGIRLKRTSGPGRLLFVSYSPLQYR
ncbi:hypothetical protein AHF37_08763 [Paragonimus kellicotti]|nr:hypothetical protein AHF37_08763 [Paragonimus kellicotti]